MKKKVQKDWAQNEIDLLLKREKLGADKDNDPEDFNYIAECAKSALRAYRSLEKDDHSGMSIWVTKGILNKLIDYKPLTPLTGDDEEWNLCEFFASKENNQKVYQNKRYSGLFKNVSANGTIKYNDINRFVCVNVLDSNDHFNFGLADRIAEQTPGIPKIEFPYVPPSSPMKIFVEEILYDETHGDFDAIKIYSTEIKDNGMTKIINIDRCFDLSVEPEREISQDKWDKFKKLSVEREQKLKDKKEN